MRNIFKLDIRKSEVKSWKWWRRGLKSRWDV